MKSKSECLLSVSIGLVVLCVMLSMGLPGVAWGQPAIVPPRSVEQPSQSSNDTGIGSTNLENQNLVVHLERVKQLIGVPIDLSRRGNLVREYVELLLLADSSERRSVTQQELAWLDRQIFSVSQIDTPSLDIYVLTARAMAGVGLFEQALSRVRFLQERARDSLQQRRELVEQLEFLACWCLHGLRRYQDAAMGYQQFLEQYPYSTYIPAVLRNLARNLAAIDEARYRLQIEAYHQRLSQDYPGSPEAGEIAR